MQYHVVLMTLLTVKDLRKKYRNVISSERGRFQKRLSEPPPRYARHDIFLAHPGLSRESLLPVVLEIEAMGFRVCVDRHNLNNAARLPAGGEEWGLLRSLLDGSRCLLYVAPDEQRLAASSAWLFGYMEHCTDKVAVLPVLDRDTGTDLFQGEGLLARYPYAGVARAMGEEADTLWVMHDPRKNINLDYWFSDRTLRP